MEGGGKLMFAVESLQASIRSLGLIVLLYNLTKVPFLSFFIILEIKNFLNPLNNKILG